MWLLLLPAGLAVGFGSDNPAGRSRLHPWGRRADPDMWFPHPCLIVGRGQRQGSASVRALSRMNWEARRR